MVNDLDSIPFKSCIFTTLNAGFEIRFISGYFLLRGAPGSRVKAECCLQDMPWTSQPQPAQGCCLPSAERFVPGIWSQKLLCALCHKAAQQWGSEDSITGAAIKCKDMCPVSRAADFRGDAGLRNPLGRASVSEHHQMCCRPVLTMARKLYSYVPHLHCASRTLILQADVGVEILIWDSSGKWLREEVQAYPWAPPQQDMGSPVGDDVVVAASVPVQLHLSRQVWMGLMNSLSVVK